MRRFHAFEFEDQPWFPAILRDAGTAFLHFVAERIGQTRSIGKAVASALAATQEREILDLCSGGGGPMVAISRELREQGYDIRVTMTDLFPSAAARASIAASDEPNLIYAAEPVDATAVSEKRAGLRTMFNAFHHFRPAVATRILASAVAAGRPILVVETLQRRIPTLLSTPLIPVLVLLSVPFLRPFRVAWLFFTYVLPLIPLFIWWDGTVSHLRTYTREELLSMAGNADPEGTFDWRVEEVPLPGPLPGLALFGLPRPRQ